MAKKLVIVESPTKAKTISRFLGNDYDVEASFGHIRDLPKSKMGIDVEKNFEPTYLIPAKSQKVVSELKSKARKSANVILATDEDREGEAIAWHLVSALGLHGDAFKRIVFHEITRNAIEEALRNPRGLDLNLIDAQQARRILDRLVGYELSPFLWKKVRYGLSAGRVQSVAVRLIVEREREIQKFIREEFWTIEAAFQKQGIKFIAKLNKIEDKILGRLEIKNEQQAKEIVSDLGGSKYAVREILKKEIARNPAAPFTTSTLQQEAARKFSMSAKQTMVIAQQLYEGINIGNHDGQTGLITYMRTDSVNLSEYALKQAEQVIKERFGSDYYAGEPRRYLTKSRNAQEAHEAIRPTELSVHPEQIKEYLDRGQQKIYELIWKRTIASQMAQAILNSTTVEIGAEGRSQKKYLFKASGQVIKFDGFIKAYTEGRDEEGQETEGQLPDLEKNEILDLQELKPVQRFTEPPGRYTDATLIKALESYGIGRPSTYAPTLSTIQERGYVEKEEKKYKPTEIGTLVNDLLVEHFPEVVDINFTAKIEEGLDEIAEGKMSWQPLVKDFYSPFKERVEQKHEEVEKQIEVSDTPCPHCGKPMLIKFGRYGKFLACPEGEKITKPMPEEEQAIKALEQKTKDEKCPVCGGPMKIQRGRFGFFLGCARYPECKGIKKILNKIGYKCPKCGEGDVVEKKSRGRGQVFYSCSRYPECEFVINKRPESEQELQELWEAQMSKPKRTAKAQKKAKKWD